MAVHKMNQAFPPVMPALLGAAIAVAVNWLLFSMETYNLVADTIWGYVFVAVPMITLLFLRMMTPQTFFEHILLLTSLFAALVGAIVGEVIRRIGSHRTDIRSKAD